MIVFKEDYRRYTRSIIDTKTPNKSFLRLASLYKEMGIKNYYFHLTLLQPELQGVCPHSEDLTLEQKAMILYECDNNPWYYLREIVLDRGAGLEIDDMRFRANRANIAAMWLMLACIDYIQIQPRQTGKSYGTDSIALWLLYFCYRDTDMNLITKDENLRKSNIKRLKKLRDEWPDYLNRNTSKDDNNQISLSCKQQGNKYFTHVSQSSSKAANNLGRGLTSPFMDIDEGPFINHIEQTVSAAMGATTAAREIAKRKGKPYCTVFTTTAGNQEDRDGKYVYDLMSGAAVWSEHFFDCRNRDELVKLIDTNSLGRATMVNLTMSHRQLGLTDEWLYEAIAKARSEGDNIDRDYFNIWTNSSSHSLLPPDVSKRVRGSEMDPISNWISKENYILRWYCDIDPNETYTIQIDTSDAIGCDDIGVIILNTRTGELCGAGAYNETNLAVFSQWLLELLLKYKNTTMIIERRYNAQVIIDYLLLKLPQYGEDPFVRMYNKVVQDKEDREDDYNKIASSDYRRPSEIYDKHRRDFGFVTDNTSRKLLYSNVMMNAAADTADKIRDKQLIQQILGLVIKNGRIDHASSGHDDMVIAWLIGHWFLNHGRNLSHYGIDSSKVMSVRSKYGKELTSIELFEREQQKKLAIEIDEIDNLLKNSNSQMDILRLERELESLMSRVKQESNEGMTFDAMKQEAKRVRDSKYGNNNGGHGAKLLLKQFGRG